MNKDLDDQLFLVYVSAGELNYEASSKNGVSSLASNGWPKSFYLELIPGNNLFICFFV